MGLLIHSYCFLLLTVTNIHGETATTTPVTETAPSYNSYEDQLKEYEYRTSTQELGIEPYGEEAAARIWSPTSKYQYLEFSCNRLILGLIPAEEWTGFYSGPVSDDWSANSSSSNDQLDTSESKSSNSSVPLETENKPLLPFRLVYHEAPNRDRHENKEPSTTTPYTTTLETVSEEPSSESSPESKYNEPDFRREMVQDVSSYGRREDSNSEGEQGYESGHVSGDGRWPESSTPALSISSSSSKAYHTTISNTESSDQSQFDSNTEMGSETRDMNREGTKVIPALSRIETENLKHEAVHFNQTNPVVYDPIAKAQSESNYLKHSPLAKHDPFDQKIHAYQYIFGQGPAHNDGKLHSFEETHEYHYPTQYLKRSDRHEQMSPSAPLSINFKEDYKLGQSRVLDDGHDGWKYRTERAQPPGKARLESYFYEGENGRKNVIYEPGSERSASKTMEMELKNWHGGEGHVDGCKGTACKWRPVSSMGYSSNPTHDLSPIRPFTSFFAPSSAREAPKFHSMYDNRDYGRPVKASSSQHDHREYHPKYNERKYDEYREPKIPPAPSPYRPRKPMYKPSPMAEFKTRPRVSRYESNLKGGETSYRKRSPSAKSEIYGYRGYGKEPSYHGSGSDRNNKFYRPWQQSSVNTKYDDSFGRDERSRSSYSSSIPDPSPYYGPYERHFPDLIAEPSASRFAAEDELMHPMMDEPNLFNDPNPVNYNYHHLNEGNYW